MSGRRLKYAFVIALTLTLALALYGVAAKMATTPVTIRVDMYLVAGPENAGAGITNVDFRVREFETDSEMFEVQYPSNERCVNVRYRMAIVLNETVSAPAVWNYSIKTIPEYTANYDGYVIHSIFLKGEARLTLIVYTIVDGVSRVSSLRSVYLEIP